MSLYDLKEGSFAFIETVGNHILEEVGLYKGVKIKMLKAGNPCIIATDRMRLCVGCVNVTVLESE